MRWAEAYGYSNMASLDARLTTVMRRAKNVEAEGCPSEATVGIA
jgi:uncharacterized protein YfcZ (UPF0381/DUF406 family)